MTKSPRVKPNKRHLQALQVDEYIGRYHPEFGEAEIEIRGQGTIATVREVREKSE